MAANRIKSSKRQRDHVISVRVTWEEKEQIKQLADQCAMKSSGYLRNIGLNYSVTSKVDAKFYYDLLLLRSELSKLGGLFKAWLSPREDLGKHAEAEELRRLNLKNNVRMLNNIDELVKSIFKFVEAL